MGILKRSFNRCDDVEVLLPYVARRKAASGFPDKAGESYFYVVNTGWATDVLARDKTIFTAQTPFDLEAAFQNKEVSIIFIPRDASITRTVAKRVCKRHGRGKTLFFEVGKDAKE